MHTLWRNSQVRTSARTEVPLLWQLKVTEPVGLYPHTKFQPNPSSRFRVTDAEILQIHRWGMHVRARGGAPLVTLPEGWADGYVATYQIWARSAKPFPSYSTVKFHNIPSLCTCHVLHSTPRSVKVWSTHGRRNVATHERKPSVNRTCGCWAITLAKAWPGRPAGRPAGRSY